MDTAIPSQGQSGRDVMVTTHILLVKKLRIREAINLLPHSVFITFYQFLLHGEEN
jgi:hypothetical protein